MVLRSQVGHGESSRLPKPVPCGPLAKAWLKRTVGSQRITCNVAVSTEPTASSLASAPQAASDLALEMLRVGWARVAPPPLPAPDYLAWQRHAMSGRYGMWATYVLDMDEWRRKAVDKTTFAPADRRLQPSGRTRKRDLAALRRCQTAAANGRTDRTRNGEASCALRS